MGKNLTLSIAAKVKALRRERKVTQAELAQYLGLSQGRLSQLEAGQGSFSAEHLLLLAKRFNVPPGSFASINQNSDAVLQNALIRLGAKHLRENEDVFPSEVQNNIHNIVREILNAPASHRVLTALACIIVENADPLLLNRLRLRLSEDRLIQRFGWLLENIAVALKKELALPLAPDVKKQYEKARFLISNLLDTSWFDASDFKKEDLLDPVVTPKSVELLKREASSISEKWKILTRVKPEDFQRNLKEASEAA
ncbi:MAG: helix-turn-helix transcriptional regulator [Deltaproteobacteria bacterium]|nr:helix-turn-helix transcriptional regulator [Deltaproteobacteria bacterium]